MGIHEGHRQRLRDSFRKDGLTGFDSIRSLELLLQYALPRRDTNPVAHALLDRFGSLLGVFNASEQELCEVEGIGSAAAVLLRLIPMIMRKSEVEKASDLRYILSTADAKNLLMPYFLYQEDELAVLLCLDSQNRVIDCREISRGVVNSVSVDLRRVVELALKLRASSIILAHNHPDGPARSSHEDDMLTRQIYQGLRTVGICFKDHLIFSRDGVFSYEDSGTLKIAEFY